jgi:hypothetical protein
MMATAAVIEHRQPLASALIKAELEALAGHAGDDQADAGPGVEPAVEHP